LTGEVATDAMGESSFDSTEAVKGDDEEEVKESVTATAGTELDGDGEDAEDIELTGTDGRSIDEDETACGLDSTRVRSGLILDPINVEFSAADFGFVADLGTMGANVRAGLRAAEVGTREVRMEMGEMEDEGEVETAEEAEEEIEEEEAEEEAEEAVEGDDDDDDDDDDDK